MKTEIEVYNEIQMYINGKKHNRPCTLASIKKVLRTQKIVDLVFSRPDIFKLEAEIKHVPAECMTDNILVRYILSNPKNFSSLNESLQTLPVLIAFELSKRRYERISRFLWGSSYEKIAYPENFMEYRDGISSICDTVSEKLDVEQLLRDYLAYIELTSVEILKHCESLNQELPKEEKYIPKYTNITLDTKERIFIFVSGYPDSGKTTFSIALANRIENSIYLDSDVLLEHDLLCTPLANLIKDNQRVVVFSDVYADRFFQKEELGDAKIINILVKPISLEKMHQNSKFMSRIPFEDYKEYEINSINYDTLAAPIVVTNDYTDKINIEIDRALEEIARRLGIALQSTQGTKTNSNEQNCLKLKRIPQ